MLINVGRGPLVQERALYDALADGVIKGCGHRRLVSLPRRRQWVAHPAICRSPSCRTVLMTPHSSGVTRDTFAGRADDIAANIVRLERGEPLRNLVTR